MNKVTGYDVRNIEWVCMMFVTGRRSRGGKRPVFLPFRLSSECVAGAESLEARVFLSTTINVTGSWSGTDTESDQTVPISGSWSQVGTTINGSFYVGPFANGYSGEGGPYNNLTLHGLTFSDVPPDTLNPAYGNDTTNIFTVAADGNSMTGTTTIYVDGTSDLEDTYSLTRQGATDLSATFTVQPQTSLSPSGTGTASFNISNSGDPATGSVSASFDLVPTDSTTNGGQTLSDVGSASASIADDVTTPDPIPVNFTVPADTPPGTYDLVGTLSDGGGITDTDTSDKTFSSTPITIIGGSDLSGQFVTPQPPETLFPGESGTAAFTLTNAEAASEADGTVDTQFYLETAPALGNGDIAISDPTLGPTDTPVTSDIDLQGGEESASLDLHFTIPASTPRGNYYVVGDIADEGGITDDNTSDKTFYSPVTISVVTPGELSNDVYTGTQGYGGYAAFSYDFSNGFLANAYSNADRSQIIIAFRGTDNAENWLSDGSFLGQTANSTLTSYVSNAALYVRELHQDYPEAHIALTGHSLGGAIAQLLGAESGLLTIAFNAPGSQQLLNSLSSELSPVIGLDSEETDTNYRIFGDQVSLAGTPIGTTVILPPPAGISFTTINVSFGNATPLGLAEADFLSNLYDFQIVHNMQNAVLPDLVANAPAYVGSIEPNYVSAIQAIVQAVSSKPPVDGEESEGLDDPETAGDPTLIDPSTGTDFVLSSTSGSPELSSIDLPSFSGVSTYNMRYEAGGTWSSFLQVAPGMPTVLAADADAVEFQPLDSSGTNVAVDSTFAFAVTFASTGTFTGTLNTTGLAVSDSDGTLTPTVTNRPLKAAFVGGSATRAKFALNLSNGGSSTVKGKATINLYASTDGEVDNSSILIGSLTHSINIKPGKATRLTVNGTLAASLIGNYTVLAEAVDPAGYSTTNLTSVTADISAPVVALTGSFVKVPTTATPKRKVAITFFIDNSNEANTSAVGTLPFDIYASADGLLADGTLLFASKKRINIKPGSSVKVTVEIDILSSGFLIVDLDPTGSTFTEDTGSVSKSFVSSSEVTVT